MAHDRGCAPGDTIFVPKAETIFISGQVAKPGEYPIRKGTTLLRHSRSPAA